MIKMNLSDRMTWAEIVKQYPDKWVGISDINRENGQIISAVVKYVDDSDVEILRRQIKFGDVETEYTNPQELWKKFPFGMATA